MTKILIFVVITCGLLVLLNIFGFNTPTAGFVFQLFNPNSTSVDTTGTSQLINYTETELPITDVESGTYFTKLFALLALLGAVGVVASFYTSSPPVEYVSAIFVSAIVLGLIVDITYILNMLWSFGMPWSMIGTLIFVPLMGALLVSAYEFWRGIG